MTSSSLSPVELDGWTLGQWIVTKGLKDGDRVLVDGFIKAHDAGHDVVKPVPYVASCTGSRRPLRFPNQPQPPLRPPAPGSESKVAASPLSAACISLLAK